MLSYHLIVISFSLGVSNETEKYFSRGKLF